jgi:hypothetical protein
MISSERSELPELDQPLSMAVVGKVIIWLFWLCAKQGFFVGCYRKVEQCQSFHSKKLSSAIRCLARGFIGAMGTKNLSL